MSRGRIFLLDPSLGATPGHHDVVARNYRALLADSGREVITVGHKNGSGDRPLFSYRVEDAFRVSRTARAWSGNAHLMSLLRALRRGLAGRAGASLAPAAGPALSNDEFARLFRGLRAGAVLDALAPRDGDDVVVLNADPAMLAALLERGNQFSKSDGPRLHLVFMYPEDDFVPPRVSAAYWALAAACAKMAAGVYAELQSHASRLAEHLGVPVASQMTPVRLSPLPAPPAGPFTVAVLGAGRVDKGYAALGDIAAALAVAAPHIRLRIQRSAHGLAAAAERAWSKSDNITLLPATLSAADYEAELTAAHALLLPYDRTAYLHRGSGVLNDALVGGRPFVCTKGTALEAAITRENGLAAATASEFAAALVHMAEHYQEFLTGASRAAIEAVAAVGNGPLVRALLSGTTSP